MKNFFFLIIVGVLGATPLYILYHDSTVRDAAATTDERAPQSVNLVEVATVEKATGVVKAERDGSFQNLNDGSAVYDQTQLHTNPLAQLSLKTKTNSHFLIFENSFVRFENRASELWVTPKTGEIRFALASINNIAFSINDGVVRCAPLTEANLHTNATSSRVDLIVDKGLCRWTDRNRKTLDIRPGEVLNRDHNHETFVTTQLTTLSQPSDNFTAPTSQKFVMQKFNWIPKSAKLDRENLEISSVRSFKPELTRSFPAHENTTIKLTQGVYFWRVSWKVTDASGSRTLFSEPRVLEVTEDHRLELVAPVDGTLFDIGSGENSIDLQWKSGINTKLYVAEISTHPDFSDLVASQTVTTTHFVFQNLPSKTYYWRVRAFGEHNEQLAESQVNSFDLRVKMGGLALVTPSPDALWEEPSPVTLTWHGAEQSDQYRVVISQDAEQKKLLHTFNVQSSTFQWKWTQAGAYYWSVKALNKNNSINSESEIRKIRIKPKVVVEIKNPFELVAPGDQSEVSLTLIKNENDSTNEAAPEFSPVTFEWKLKRKIQGSTVLLTSRNADFSEALRQEHIQNNSLSINLRQPGVYYWKLQSQAADGKILDTSSVGTFTLKAPPIPVREVASVPESASAPAVPAATPVPTPIPNVPVDAPQLNVPVIK